MGKFLKRRLAKRRSSPLTKRRPSHQQMIKAAKKEIAIEAKKVLYTYSDVARHVEVVPATIYEWLKEDPEFRKAMEEADKLFTDIIREKIQERAFGFEKPVFYRGELMLKRDSRGLLMLDDDFEAIPLMQPVHSDRMLERMAEAKANEYKRERNKEHTTNIDNITISLIPSPSASQWETPDWNPDTGRLKQIDHISTKTTDVEFTEVKDEDKV